jgi:hypothetical protein
MSELDQIHEVALLCVPTTKSLPLPRLAVSTSECARSANYGQRIMAQRN